MMRINLTGSLSVLLALLAATLASPAETMTAGLSAIPNRIVLIRHAEKGYTPENGGDKEPGPPGRPPGGPPGRKPTGRGLPGGPGAPGGPGGGKMPNGLSDKGRERAQYIRTLLGRESEFDFGLIFAAPYNASTKDTERTYATVAPLAKDLGLSINIDCANAEPHCVVKQIRHFAETSDADILISWKHFYLNLIATELGANNARETYPGDRNDVIWIMQGDAIIEKRSMHCPVLDDGRNDDNDPDLAIEQPRANTVWEIFRLVLSLSFKKLRWLLGA